MLKAPRTSAGLVPTRHWLSRDLGQPFDWVSASRLRFRGRPTEGAGPGVTIPMKPWGFWWLLGVVV